MPECCGRRASRLRVAALVGSGCDRSAAPSPGVRAGLPCLADAREGRPDDVGDPDASLFRRPADHQLDPLQSRLGVGAGGKRAALDGAGHQGDLPLLDDTVNLVQLGALQHGPIVAPPSSDGFVDLAESSREVLAPELDQSLELPTLIPVLRRDGRKSLSVSTLRKTCTDVETARYRVKHCEPLVA